MSLKLPDFKFNDPKSITEFEAARDLIIEEFAPIDGACITYPSQRSTGVPGVCAEIFEGEAGFPYGEESDKSSRYTRAIIWVPQPGSYNMPKLVELSLKEHDYQKGESDETFHNHDRLFEIDNGLGMKAVIKDEQKTTVKRGETGRQQQTTNSHSLAEFIYTPEQLREFLQGAIAAIRPTR